MSKRSKFYFITPITCMLSMLTSSLQGQPYEGNSCCCEEDQCVPCNPCNNGGRGWGRDLAIFAGAAAVGAIAGVVAANSNKKKGHRGERGEQGDPGETGATGATGAAGLGFVAAPAGVTLTFTESLIVTIPILAGTLTPFVETPDGRTLLGAPIVGAAIITGALPPITDPTPVFGTYHFGFVLSAGFATAGLSASTLVTTNRAGAAPTTQFIATSLNIAPDQTQAIGEFAFGNVPPVP